MSTFGFDRIELKYLVDAAQRRAITEGLRGCTPDVHGDPEGRYPITSAYYDGPDFHVYWDRERGIPSRRKLRLRIYGDSATAGAPASFLEIKHKYGRRIAKRRVALSIEDGLQVGRGLEAGIALGTADRAVVEEARRMVAAQSLAPTCCIRYERQAFQGSEPNADLRVTFDDHLGCRSHDLVPRPDDTDYPTPLLPDGLSVLEIKVDVSAPKWLADLVAAAGCVKRPMSKYSWAVVALGLVEHAGDAPPPITASISAARRRAGVHSSLGAVR